MFGKIFTIKGFTKRDFFLWGGSIVLILASFFIFDRENFGSTPKVVEKVRKDKKRRGSACQRQGKFLKQNL